MLLFNYASKILVSTSKNFFLYILLSLCNTCLTYLAISLPQYYYLSFFAVFIAISLQFKLISKSSFRQSFFGGVTFAFHIASINLPVLMSFSYFLDVASLTLLHDPYYHTMILSVSITILILALLIVSKIIPIRDIIRISSSSPYSETQTATTFFILAYVSFDTYFLVTHTFFTEKIYHIFMVVLLSLVIFYYLLFYTISFINLAAYKRQSDIAQSNYDNLLLKKKEVSNKLITDNLTKLFNRSYIIEQLEKLLATPHIHFGLLFMDVNALKHVNDTFGHEVGDEYIKAIADALRESIRDVDIVARISGDEFLAILPYIESKDSVTNITKRISMQIDQQAKLKDFKLSASIGFIYVNEEMKKLSTDEIIDLADANMRENKILFYSDKLVKQEVSND